MGIIRQFWTLIIKIYNNFSIFLMLYLFFNISRWLNVIVEVTRCKEEWICWTLETLWRVVHSISIFDLWCFCKLRENMTFDWQSTRSAHSHVITRAFILIIWVSFFNFWAKFMSLLLVTQFLFWLLRIYFGSVIVLDCVPDCIASWV